MSKYIDADLLRKEIEKNKNMIDGLFTEGDDSVYDGENDAYNRVLRIIDSLQQEQQEEPSKSLEEEISRTYHDGSVADTSDIDHVAYENIAHHFAEWGAEHLRDSTKMIDESLDEAAGRYEAYYDVGEEHGYLYCLAGDIKNAFIAGAEWQKQQMIEETVEGYVDKDHIVTEGPFYYIRSRNLDLPNRLKEGDKVRIIVLKAEEE